jgi:hypothetical protein
LGKIDTILLDTGLGGSTYTPSRNDFIIHHIRGQEYSVTAAKHRRSVYAAIEALTNEFKDDTITADTLWFKHDRLLNDWKKDPLGESYDKLIEEGRIRSTNLGIPDRPTTVEGAQRSGKKTLRGEPLYPYHQADRAEKKSKPRPKSDLEIERELAWVDQDTLARFGRFLNEVEQPGHPSNEVSDARSEAMVKRSEDPNSQYLYKNQILKYFGETKGSEIYDYFDKQGQAWEEGRIRSTNLGIPDRPTYVEGRSRSGKKALRGEPLYPRYQADRAEKKSKPHEKTDLEIEREKHWAATGQLVPQYAIQKTADVWHSKMEKFLSDKLPGKGPPKQLKTMIQGWANKGQFKQEELAWSGLQEWLDDPDTLNAITMGEFIARDPRGSSGKTTNKFYDYLGEGFSDIGRIPASPAVRQDRGGQRAWCESTGR